MIVEQVKVERVTRNSHEIIQGNVIYRLSLANFSNEGMHGIFQIVAQLECVERQLARGLQDAKRLPSR